MPLVSRRTFVAALASAPLAGVTRSALAKNSAELRITATGAVADGATVNTKAIQAAIDRLAAKGGGTVVVPAGTFVTGALFFKPKVHLRLEAGAVLQCSQNVAVDFPAQRTRIEGHFEEHFTPALINASHCDGFQLTGEGTLDGAGRPVWDEFWKLRRAAANPGNFPNIGLPRARLALIDTCRDVRIEGVTFKDSQFWNLHLYHCDGVLVQRVRFEVPDDYKQAPSTDGIDIDSSRNVTVDGCYFSVTDDCIACKGSRGVHALEDKTSPPVEHIRVRNCTYKRGGGVLTLGSEATVVRDVIVENSKITGRVRVATLKLRPDTPQHYEDITIRNITSEADAPQIITILPWSQYANLQGMAPPHSIVHNISLIGIKGTYDAFGAIKPNPGQTEISGIVFQDFDVTLKKDQLAVAGVEGLKFENVVVNGKAQTTPVPEPVPAKVEGFEHE